MGAVFLLHVLFAQLDDDSRSLLEGTKTYLSMLDTVYLEYRVQEYRLVDTDGDSEKDMVPLIPTDAVFASEGLQTYRWHNGGTFRGDLLQPEEGTYEYAFNGDRSTFIAHHERRAIVSTEDTKGTEGATYDPRDYFGHGKLDEVVEALAEDGVTIGNLSQIEYDGATCSVVELFIYGTDDMVQLTIDPSIGFAVREARTYWGDPGDPESLYHICRMSSFEELWPGVWMPRSIEVEGGFRYDNGLHSRREIKVDVIEFDIATHRSKFQLDVPPRYRVEDKILGITTPRRGASDEALTYDALSKRVDAEPRDPENAIQDTAPNAGEDGQDIKQEKFLPSTGVILSCMAAGAVGLGIALARRSRE